MGLTSSHRNQKCQWFWEEKPFLIFMWPNLESGTLGVPNLRSMTQIKALATASSVWRRELKKERSLPLWKFPRRYSSFRLDSLATFREAEKRPWGLNTWLPSISQISATEEMEEGSLAIPPNLLICGHYPTCRQSYDNIYLSNANQAVYVRYRKVLGIWQETVDISCGCCYSKVS